MSNILKVSYAAAVMAAKDAFIWKAFSCRICPVPMVFLFVAVCWCSLAACQSLSERQERENIAKQQAHQQVAVTKPRQDLRKLRPRLLGKSMREVLAILGKPEKVLVLGGGTETWDYFNAAYDSITGLPVDALTIWFENRKVDRITSSF